jgi:hypothetical protein
MPDQLLVTGTERPAFGWADAYRKALQALRKEAEDAAS